MTIQVTSIPDALDAILALIRALNLKVENDPVEVFDGLAGPNVPDVFVQVGGIDQTAVDGDQEWHSFGSPAGIAPNRDERYRINCGVFAYVGGADAGESSASDAQKSARDIAFTILAAIERGLRENVKLESADNGADGLIVGGLNVGWVEFGGHMSLEETTRNDPEAGKGRRAVVLFEVGVFKRLSSF